ncbi:MAG: lipoyl(octanoyl) transferase LipB [Candidatus Eisenbacteria bacterium]|uniref:Octanoyltransferase n=1 Tax=Eiseniibacteriota bacterium TaxID=2212470 RepID=A0A948RV25_UNCEI|nr:lipoyl(octanoyl) transferase LipB [Candidatus Eisenbacteria bacterium]MBU1950208.1 lipoyl(octanoyl) transferase LipB [Candidatus Eisenbacteria bacterium]MBU2691395.1 lipoyl(octanoyl) transferase LipB [Candidatus Eisenbacteria bacterium]
MRVALIHGLSPYRPLWALQKSLCAQRERGECEDTLLLLEHEPTITLGRSAREENVKEDRTFLRNEGFEIVKVDRGGDVTYHGPGQLTGYFIFDLKELRTNLHQFIATLEEVMIRTAACYGIRGGRVEGLTGVWVGDRKIGAIGVHIRRWISTHGIAFNVKTDLEAFSHIVPCGLSDRGVTSVADAFESPPELDEVAGRMIPIVGDLFRREPHTIEFASSIEACLDL